MTNRVTLPPPVTHVAAGPVGVTDEDVAAVIDAMEVGGLYLNATLFAAYVTLVEAEGREAGNRQAFGHALRRSGRVVQQRTRNARLWVRKP